MDVFVYYTELVGSRVYSHYGRYLGRVKDIITRAEEFYPKVLKFVIRAPFFGQVLDVPWEVIRVLEKGKVILVPEGEMLMKQHRVNPDEIELEFDILDMQILDTNGAKVVRVNDIHLLNTGNEMRLAHVDVSFRGILRRLGYLHFIDAITNWLFSTKFKEQLIAWKYIIPLGGHFSPLKLKLPLVTERLADLHPADIADIMEELAVHERQAIFSSLDVETAGETLEEIDNPKLQTELLGSVNEEVASDILEEMDPDEAADILSDLPDDVTDDLIDAMEDKERAEDIRQLMTHEEGTAGSIMTTEFLAVNSAITLSQALDYIRKEAKDIENTHYMYVINDKEVLLGALSLKELIIADNELNIKSIMEKRVVSVKYYDSVKLVTETLGKYNLTTLPVVDDAGHLLGVIQWKDAVEAVYTDFAED